MTEFDLFDSIGNIDDEFIEKAAEQKKSHIRLFSAAASLAACVTIACVGLFVLKANQSDLIPTKVAESTSSSSSDVGDVYEYTTAEISESTTGETYENTVGENLENTTDGNSENAADENAEDTTGVNSENTSGETSGNASGKNAENSADKSSENSAGESSEDTPRKTSAETVLLRESYKIYYVKYGKIESKTQECGAAPKEVFELWKKANNVGDDVQFVSVKIEDNGVTSYYEYSGVCYAEYTPGDYTIYRLTVTRNLENYYGENKELLLESLKKTMTGMCESEPDEYVMTFDDEEQTGNGE